MDKDVPFSIVYCHSCVILPSSGMRPGGASSHQVACKPSAPEVLHTSVPGTEFLARPEKLSGALSQPVCCRLAQPSDLLTGEIISTRASKPASLRVRTHHAVDLLTRPSSWAWRPRVVWASRLSTYDGLCKLLHPYTIKTRCSNLGHLSTLCLVYLFKTGEADDQGQAQVILTAVPSLEPCV